MRPEIWKKERYGLPSDIWSIGCVMYELAMLKLPFHQKNLFKLKTMIINNMVPPIKGNYSDVLKRFVLRLLNKDPELRPTVGKSPPKIIKS